MESERRGGLARSARGLAVEPGGAAGEYGPGAEAGFRGPARVFGAAGAAGAWVARGPTALRRAVAGLDAAFKRAVDIALAGGMLLFSLPLALLAAAAIKLEDGGRVFYGQERVGRRGRRFRSWKFRSMKPRERTDGPLKQAGLEEHRITRVGRLMRACAFDEMPQLWNICRGDMSFVGPRALLPAEVEAAGNGEPVRLEEVPGYEERHLVRPGLTGLAQVYAARDVPHRWKFRYDLLYVRTRTPWLDLSLIARSMWISVRGAWPEVGKGAG